MGQKQTASEPPKQTFESAIERLERIVEEMEGDNLPLEQLLERYEEGSRLVKVCQEKLETAEKRVELITRGASGKPQVAAFEPSAAAVAAETKEDPEAKEIEHAAATGAGKVSPKKSAPSPAAADVSLF
jgi:exodeoxyribonuclease VII small subunit